MLLRAGAVEYDAGMRKSEGADNASTCRDCNAIENRCTCNTGTGPGNEAGDPGDSNEDWDDHS